MNTKVRPGFTLIELLVVIAIIGVLSTLAIVALGSARQKSRDAKRVADLNQIGKALELYYNDNNAYPTIITPGQPIASGSTVYLAQVPSNPAPRNDGTCTNSNYTYSASSSGNAYTVGACLGGSTGSIVAGGVFISSANGSGVQGCGQSLITDLEGNAYTTVQIGSQCWMAQGLRLGTKILLGVHPANNGIIEKACYNDTEANCLTDGGLYEWNEAMQYVATSGAQGICPTGWHIPSHDEMTTLERSVCTSGTCATDFPYDTSVGWKGTTEGTKLKPGGTSGFYPASDVLAGDRQSGAAAFNYRTTQGFFWASSEATPAGANAWARNFLASDPRVYRDIFSKAFSFSVRCVQN